MKIDKVKAKKIELGLHYVKILLKVEIAMDL